MNLFTMDDRDYELVYGKYYSFEEFYLLNSIIRLDVKRTKDFNKSFVNTYFSFIMGLLLFSYFIWGVSIIYFSYISNNWLLSISLLSFILFPNIKETTLRFNKPYLLLLTYIILFAIIDYIIYYKFGFYNLLTFYFIFGSIIWSLLIFSEIIYEFLAKKLFIKNETFYEKALNEDIIRLYLR